MGDIESLAPSTDDATRANAPGQRRRILSGVERVADVVEAAAGEEREWLPRLSAGLRAGLDALASSPALARLLLVESLAGPRSVRLEHERMLDRLAQALREMPSEPLDVEGTSAERARLLAGGIVTYLSGRVLAGEAERLGESHDPLLIYLQTASRPVVAAGVDERHTARA